MILYNRENYNCAHHAVKRLNDWHGCNIAFADGDVWQVDFIKMLRKEFKPVKRPVNKCLVVMVAHGQFHLGVYDNFTVEHNYNADGMAGSVILNDMGTIRSEFERVRFYVYDKKVH